MNFNKASLSFSSKNLLAQGYKAFLINFIRQTGKIDLLELKLVIGQSLQSFLASLFINKALSLQIEEHKNIANFFLAKYSYLESYAYI